ncbi:helix-turn-helix domain-containing protein [Pandoraea iniqua]|nr:helix-turn-helix domain-containing protein [Pandoraea iniqua]
MAIAIKLNQSHMGSAAVRTTRVAVTYSEFEDLTGFSRATISGALELLEGMNAITSERVGRRRYYDLPQTAVMGDWCQLPQKHLIGGTASGVLRRLTTLPTSRRACLNAMKLYVLLLAYRNRRINIAAIGYDKIMELTGMRRQDIPEASSLLVAHELIRAQGETDDMQIEYRSKRYRVIGLEAVVGGMVASTAF